MEENVVVAEPRKDNSLLQFSLISALVSVLFYVALYLNGAETFIKPIAYLSVVIPIVFAVIAAQKTKKTNGYLPFNQALKIVFGIFVLSSFSVTLFSYLLYHYIDPAFAERMFQLTIQKTQEWMMKFGVRQEEIDKQVKVMMNMDMYSFGALMKSFFYQCILNFLFSLIIAAIVKKNKPEFTA